jgi:hypothetical protein
MTRSNHRLVVGLIGTLAAGVGIVAYAAPAPITLYSYDNVGNLRGVTNSLSDPSHCGTVSTVCPGSTNGSAVCQDGQCGVLCDPGFSLCKGACMSIAVKENTCVCRSAGCIMAAIMPLLQ